MAKNSTTAKKKVDPEVDLEPQFGETEGAPLVRLLQVRDNETKTVPKKAHDTDAGYDLICSQNTVISTGAKAMVPTNIAIQVPDGMFALVLPRSSAFYKKGLIVHPGTIDPGYRGEIQVLVWNPTTRAVYLSEADSIAQLVFLPCVDVRFDTKGKLEASERGTGGFGSTGRVPGNVPLGPLQP